jgi:hypothetical protein
MRKIQLFLAYLGSIFLFIVLAIEATAPVILVGFVYLITYCVIVSDLVKSGKMTFAMNFFLLFFGIGHVIKTGLVLLNKEIHQAVGWITIGTFDFSIEAMISLFIVEISMLLGGYFVIKIFTSNGKLLSKNYQYTISKKYSKILLLSWFVLSLFLILLINKLGFGQHGVAPSDEAALPYGIAGFLIYFRNLAVPALGLVFLQWYLKVGDRRRWVGYLVYTIVSMAIAIYSLSRSAFVGAMIPLIIVYINSKRISLRRVVAFLALAIALLSAMSLINNYRLTIYNKDIDTSNIFKILKELQLKEVISIVGFIVDRIEGSRELMAVISSDIKGLSSLFDTFFYGSEVVLESVMGFVPLSEGMAFGMTYGMAGLLFISGSYLVVFIGTIIYLTGLFYIERIFLMRGYVMASMFVSLVIFANIWGNMTWFFFVRFIFMSLFTYIIIRYIEKRMLRHRRKRPKLGEQVSSISSACS